MKRNVWLVLILMSLMFTLSGCSLLRLSNPLSANAGAKYVSSQNYEKEYIHDKEQGLTYYKINRTKDKVVPKMTFAQKIGAWIGGISTLGIILLIVGFFVAPGATFTILYSMARSALKVSRRAFKETAMAIKISGAVNRDDELHNSLKSVQSESTKKMVGELKAEL